MPRDGSLEPASVVAESTIQMRLPSYFYEQKFYLGETHF